MLAIEALAAMLCVRFTFGSSKGAVLPVFVWFLLLAITLTLTPWILTGRIDYGGASSAASLFFFVMAALAAMLLGVLATAFLLFAAITAAIFLLSAALDDLPAGRIGWLPGVAAVLGLPGSYTVTNPALLWAARALIVLVVGVSLAAPRRRRAAQGETGHTDGTDGGTSPAG